MDRWDEDPQENHVVVRYKDNESAIVKVSSNTTVSQVLSRVCEKWNLQPEKHFLKYHTEEPLENDRNIGISIPPNSTLHVEEFEPERDSILDDEMVYVSLQLEGTIFRKPFQKTDSLSHVLNELYDASGDTFSRRDASKHKHHRSSSGKRMTSKCKIILAKHEKLLILLPNGTVTLDQAEFDNTVLGDFNHGGHIFLTFMIEDLEDVPLLDDDQYEVLHSSQDENSQIFHKCERQDLFEDDSQPSVAKIRHLLADGLNQKSEEDQKSPLLTDVPLREDELFERYGLVYKMNGDNGSSSDILQMKEKEELSGVYTQTWISICFQDNLAIQASFAPSEYVKDIKAYVKKFLFNPFTDFQLSYGGTGLDEKESIFSSGLVPSAKLHFVPVYQEITEETEVKNLQKTPNETQSNGLDPKFTNKIVTQSVAAATAISFSQTSPEITIESEAYRPKSEETTWEKVKIISNSKQSV